jgi:hypothetical protein
MRFPALDCYEGEEGQEEGSKDGQYTLQVRICSLELF